MHILNQSESLDFESRHETELWFYQPVESVYKTECPRDLYHVKGLFNSIYKHPDYVAQSPIKNDKFITFEHEGEYAVLVYESAISDYMLYVDEKKHTKIVHAMLTTYLKKYNADNLQAFPVLAEIVKEKKPKKEKAVKLARTVKSEAKPKTSTVKKGKAKKELPSE